MGNININSGKDTNTRDIISGGDQEPENESKWKKYLLWIGGIISGLAAIAAALKELF